MYLRKVLHITLQIMEQVEGGDLVVNKGDESRPKETTSEKRDLNAVAGLEEALKLAQVNPTCAAPLCLLLTFIQANLDEIIKRNVQPPPTASSAQNPTTYSYVYLRIQPFTTTLVLPEQAAAVDNKPTEQTNLQFILYLSDPAHQITHSTITQAVPGKWLDLWDEYDWVEDLVVEAIRVGVEVVGQEYIVSRMGWDQKKLKDDTETVQEASETASI